MKETIKKLWYDYLYDEEADISNDAERKRINHAMVERSAELQNSLTQEQKKLFDKYAEALYEYVSYEQYKGFEKGSEFAVRFVTESQGR